jgi:hypothetical protein
MPLSRETCPAATEPAPVYDFADRLGNCFRFYTGADGNSPYSRPSCIQPSFSLVKAAALQLLRPRQTGVSYGHRALGAG